MDTLGQAFGLNDRPGWRDDPQLTQGRHQPMVKQQITGQRDRVMTLGYRAIDDLTDILRHGSERLLDDFNHLLGGTFPGEICGNLWRALIACLI
jgi:hypothetical protein